MQSYLKRSRIPKQYFRSMQASQCALTGLSNIPARMSRDVFLAFLTIEGYDEYKKISQKAPLPKRSFRVR